MSTTTRPLTGEEQRALARLASPRAQRSGELLAASVVFLFTFMVGVWVARWLGGTPQGRTLGWIAAGAAVAALALLAYMRRGVGSVLARERGLHAEDLARGVAERATYEITDALRVEEFEDEGSSYYLRLAQGGVLFLSGQYLYEYEVGESEDGQPTPARFPCRSFTLERAAASGLFLDLQPLGPPFEPSDTLPAFTLEEHGAGVVPEDGQVLALDFEALRARRAG